MQLIYFIALHQPFKIRLESSLQFRHAKLRMSVARSCGASEETHRELFLTAVPSGSASVGLLDNDKLCEAVASVGWETAPFIGRAVVLSPITGRSPRSECSKRQRL